MMRTDLTAGLVASVVLLGSCGDSPTHPVDPGISITLPPSTYGVVVSLRADGGTIRDVAVPDVPVQVHVVRSADPGLVHLVIVSATPLPGVLAPSVTREPRTALVRGTVITRSDRSGRVSR